MSYIKQFCEAFYAAHYLPMACCHGSELLTAVGFPDGWAPYERLLPTLRQFHHFPAFYTSGDGGFYGLLKLKDYDDHWLLVGPAFSTLPNGDVVRAFMRENAIANRQEDETRQFLSSIPLLTYHQFLNLLSFLQFTLNSEYTDVREYLDEDAYRYVERIASSQAEKRYQARDEQITHGTYLFEQRMLSLIRQGNLEGLKTLLYQVAQAQPLPEGPVADTPLRHAKNIFLGMVVLVGKTAAIPGGVDVEEAYQLIETYSQECERMNSVDSVNNLRLHMLLDFTARVARSQTPQQLSLEISRCVQYIQAHVNGPISVDDLAEHIGKSRSYVTDRFRQETGSSIGQFISNTRIAEAKSLLRYTDKPLDEISSYLNYSSQSYFQNVFKKTVGCTPMQYRKRQNES